MGFICLWMKQVENKPTLVCICSSAGQILHPKWTTKILHPTPARDRLPLTHPTYNSQVVLLAPTLAILPDPQGRISQVSRVIKVIRSMDGKMHLHLQDRCTQRGLKTQVHRAAVAQSNRNLFCLKNAWVHVDLEVMWLSGSGVNRAGGGGGLFEVGVLIMFWYIYIFLPDFAVLCLW